MNFKIVIFILKSGKNRNPYRSKNEAPV
eukprot:SAG31_NODE_26542_length_440_cov_1.202346_1_plen_27_part_10